jgi:alkylation response protein AidB-like acyl-CoA dehydrogenase
MVTASVTEVSAQVDSLRPLIEESADASEKARKVEQPVIDALTRTGLFHTFVPADLGGGEIDLPSALRLFERLCAVDGSTGWVAMICASSGILASYLPKEGAREVFGEGPGVVTCGVVAPKGKAVTVDGGYRVSGRWPFASGCHHSGWVALNCMTETNGEIEMTPMGMPNLRFTMLPVSDVKILDTWHVAGLRATGSNDIVADDVFVPADHSYGFFSDQPRSSATLYKVSIPSLFASAVAACALGIARGALDEIRAVVGQRMPASISSPLSEWGHAQMEYARGEAALRSARAFLYESLQEVWDEFDRGETPTIETQAMVRLASTQAMEGSVRATDIAYALGGGSAIYESSTLQRRFRDIHTMTQHFLVAPATIEFSGRAFFGLETPPGFL